MRFGPIKRSWHPALAGWSLAALMCVPVIAAHRAATGQPPEQQPYRFRTGVDLVNLAVTVTDENGRFVRGLKKDDFTVFEDGEPQPISHFSSERVPVSLGIALDTSGSMAGPKIDAARGALDRFLAELLDRDDEIFLFRFSGTPVLVQPWTTNRDVLHRALASVRPDGSTALYDTVAEAAPLAQTGKNKKKALVVISDGNDTDSRTSLTALKQMIRETEVLVYAIGIDSDETGAAMPRGKASAPPPPPPSSGGQPRPKPFPVPGGGSTTPPEPPKTPQPPVTRSRVGAGDRVNEDALRQITDDSGGRTEIIRSARDLDPATAGIADELSRQYFLAYAAPSRKDGKWHEIRVEPRDRRHHVRARRGYVASSTESRLSPGTLVPVSSERDCAPNGAAAQRAGQSRRRPARVASAALPR